MGKTKILIFSILAFIVASCGSKQSDGPQELSYVSITKEAGGPVACQGCAILDYEGDSFFLTYQPVGGEVCSGAAIYNALDTIVLPTQNGETIRYDVQKISGPNDLNCFPPNTTFEITAQADGVMPARIEFFTGLDIFDMCLSSGCN